VFCGIRLLAIYILLKNGGIVYTICPPVSINSLRKFLANSREIFYWCLHQSSPAILTANSYLSNITSVGIKTAKNVRRQCACSVAVNLFTFDYLSVYLLFVSCRRRLVGLCILLNWLTERNCLIFRDVQKKKRQEKTQNVPISRKFCTKRQLSSTWKSDQTQQSTMA